MINNKALSDSLNLLGLNSKEIRFYLAVLELGPCTTDQAVSKARLKRATGFLLAKDLAEKGILEKELKTYRKKLYAVSPKEILRMISGKQRLFRRQELELEGLLPDLESAYGKSNIRPQVRVFSGRNGLVTVWKDILSTRGEVLLWSNQDKESRIFTAEDHAKFIAERVKKNIPIRVLTVNNSNGRLLSKGDSNLLRQTKLLPDSVDFSAETYIYGSKIAILDYYKDIIGVIVESGPMSASQRAIFEMNWTLLK